MVPVDFAVKTRSIKDLSKVDTTGHDEKVTAKPQGNPSETTENVGGCPMVSTNNRLYRIAWRPAADNSGNRLAERMRFKKSNVLAHAVMTLAMSAASAVTVVFAATSPAVAAPPLANTIVWGTTMQTVPADQANCVNASGKCPISDFESQVGRTLATTRVYINWTDPFPGKYLDWLISRGTTPVISIQLDDPDYPTGRVPFADIVSAAAGTGPQAATFNLLKAHLTATLGGGSDHLGISVNGPIYVAFDHEPETTVHASDLACNKTTDGSCHVADGTAFQAAFAAFSAMIKTIPNAKTMFIMTGNGFGTSPDPTKPKNDSYWQAPQYWYPTNADGTYNDANIDAIGVDAYNAYECDGSTEGWTPLYKKIAGFRAFLDPAAGSGQTAVASRIQAWVTEYGSTPADPTVPSTDRGAWISDATGDLPSGTRPISGAIYFNSQRSTTCHWELDGTRGATPDQLALNAYSAMGCDLRYRGGLDVTRPPALVAGASQCTGDWTAPSAPSVTSASSATNSVTLNWGQSTDSGGGSIAGYIVSVYKESDGGLVATSPLIATGLTATVSGLTSDTAYTASVVATDNSNNLSAPSAATNVMTFPDAPASLAVTTGLQTATLSWTAATDTAVSYAVSVFNAGAPVAGATVAYNGTRDGATVSNLTPGTPYTFTVVAQNAGGSSLPSSKDATTVADIIAPSIPGNLHTTSPGTETSVDLAWNASTDNIAVTGYVVLKNGVAVQTVTGLNTSVPGLTVNTTYSFTVEAKDAAGNTSTPSNAVGFTTPDQTPPSAPQNLTAPNATQQSVSLSWTASSDNVGVTAYDVYNGSTLVPGAWVSGTVATVSGLTPSTSYTFTVKARDAAGNTSGASNPVTKATASTGPTAPGAPTVGVVNGGMLNADSGVVPPKGIQVKISWTASTSSAGITQYVVNRQTNGTGPVTLVATVTGTNPAANTTVFEPPTTGATYYTYQVTATDGAGISATGAATPTKIVLDQAETVLLNSGSHTGTWTTNNPLVTTNSGGSTYWSTALNNTATYKPPVGTTSVAIVVRKTPTSAAIKVTLDGVVQTSATSLYAVSTAFRTVVLVVPITTSGQHTIVVTTVADPAHATNKDVQLDAFVSVTSDATKPTNPGVPQVTMGTGTLNADTATPAKGVPVKLTWAASTDASGVDHYEVRYGTTASPFGTLAPAVPGTATTTTIFVAPGSTYVFEVRAVDTLGNVSADTVGAGAGTTVTLTQETPATGTVYSPTTGWVQNSLAAASGGTVRTSTVSGNSVTYTVPAGATGVGFVTTTGSSYGSFKVSWDGGTLSSAVSLSGAGGSRQIEYTKAFNSGTTHTLKIVTTGKVDADAFITFS